MKKLAMAISAACMTIASLHAQIIDSEESLSDKYYVQITQAQQSKNWKQVAELVGQLIEANEDVTDYEVAYAQALGELGNQGEAISRLEQYLKNYETDFQAYQVLGDLYASNYQRPKAVQAYEKCGQLRPDYARPFVSLARLYGEKDKERAIANYNKSIRVFLQADRPDAAIQIGLEAMKIDKTDMTLLMLMGDALTKADMEDNALPFYAEVLSQAPNFDDNSANIDMAIEANFSIAMIYYKKRQYKMSYSFLEKMYKSEPLLSSDRKAYAMMLCLGAADKTMMGDMKGATKLLDKAKKYDPEGYEKYFSGLLSLNQ